VSRDAIEACVALGIRERAPIPDLHYVGFVDPSGGSADSFTLAIGHRQELCAIVDAVREVRPPFSPESVVSELVGLLQRYRISNVVGDRYGGEWPREAFRKLGIRYELVSRSKSDLYRDFLPLINSRQVDLLDLPRSVAQLCSLERRTARGGRDSIDHAPGAHDDIANAIAGLAVHLGGALGYNLNLDWIDGPDTDVAPVDPAAATQVNGIHFKSAWQRIQFRNHILSARHAAVVELLKHRRNP
jgi:hypothetical protein